MRAPLSCSLLLLAVVAAGCSDSPTGPDGLSEARARWSDSRITDYTVESRIFCFCPAHLGVWTQLTVRGDSIIAAEAVEESPYASTTTEGWRTVNGLFDVAAAAAGSDVVAEVATRFDPALGYPREIRIRCVDTIADCGVTYEARNLVPLK
jgi:hypothetical protein